MEKEALLLRQEDSMELSAFATGAPSGLGLEGVLERALGRSAPGTVEVNSLRGAEAPGGGMLRSNLMVDGSLVHPCQEAVRGQGQLAARRPRPTAACRQGSLARIEREVGG